MSIHLIGFPHTTFDGNATCAYTQKLRKFVAMGWDDLHVYHGGGKVQPEGDLPYWPDAAEWEQFNRRVMPQVREQSQPGDLLLLAGGLSQKLLADAMPWLLACEPGVGYSGVTWHPAAYESVAWRHHVYGMYRKDGRPYDTVIPNFFDVADWPNVNQGGGDYLLFVGRLIRRKGPDIAAEIAKRVGMRLVIAGPGATSWSEGEVIADEITVQGDIQYVGTVTGHDLSALMAGAAAVIVPTLYVEPFGGVAVEAMLSGTPVVASDWGAFTETVEEGVTGYRFSTLIEGEEAVHNAMSLDPATVRARAIERYSLDAVKPMYERWFARLETLYHGGYYAERAVA